MRVLNRLVRSVAIHFTLVAVTMALLGCGSESDETVEGSGDQAGSAEQEEAAKQSAYRRELMLAQQKRESAEQRLALTTLKIKDFLQANPVDEYHGPEPGEVQRLRLLITQANQIEAAIAAAQADYEVLTQVRDSGETLTEVQEKLIKESAQTKESLSKELGAVADELKGWREVRMRYNRLVEEYKLLLSEHEAAEQERDEADQEVEALENLIEPAPP
ncbi:MAG: hypothetical protein AAGB26_07895 [Planctomycetota bacterium]